MADQCSHNEVQDGRIQSFKATRVGVAESAFATIDIAPATVVRCLTSKALDVAKRPAAISEAVITLTDKALSAIAINRARRLNAATDQITTQANLAASALRIVDAAIPAAVLAKAVGLSGGGFESGWST